LQFRCDRGVKQFSQRPQRLRSVRNVCPDRRREPKPVFSSINGIAMVPVLISRLGKRDSSVAVDSTCVSENIFFPPSSRCESIPQNDIPGNFSKLKTRV
jgi:hypothetical protein